MDRFDRLVNLLTLDAECGELPITMALANVVPSQQLVRKKHITALNNNYDGCHVIT